MRAALPRLSRFLSGSADLAALDASEKQARQALLAGMAFAVHRTQVEELIAEGVALFLLSEDVLQREGEFAEAGGFGPRALGSSSSVSSTSEKRPRRPCAHSSRQA